MMEVITEPGILRLSMDSRIELFLHCQLFPSSLGVAALTIVTGNAIAPPSMRRNYGIKNQESTCGSSKGNIAVVHSRSEQL